MVLVMVCVLQGIEELSPGAAPRDPHVPTEFLWPTPAKVGFRGFWSSLGTVCPHPCCPTSPSILWHLPLYPWGSFLLQLANTKSAWLRMGGRPRACDTSQ